MKYMLIIQEKETNWNNYSEAEAGNIMDGYGAFTEELAQSGAMIAGDRLQPTHTAKTVRVTNGKTELADGPAENTDMQFGGFYIVEAPDIDAAAAVAAKIPTAQTGAIEVRPIWEFEG